MGIVVDGFDLQHKYVCLRVHNTDSHSASTAVGAKTFLPMLNTDRS